MAQSTRILVRELIEPHLDYDLPTDYDELLSMEQEDIDFLFDHVREVLFSHGISVRFQSSYSSLDRYILLLSVFDRHIDVSAPRMLGNGAIHDVVFAEEQDRNSRSILDLTGPQTILPAEKVEPSTLRRELERLNDLLLSQNISVDCYSDISDIDLYRFITEAVLNTSIEVPDDPDEIVQFIYEEYNPDCQYILDLSIEKFLTNLQQPDWDDAFAMLGSTVVASTATRRLRHEEAVNHIAEVRAKYSMLYVESHATERTARTKDGGAIAEASVTWVDGYGRFSTTTRKETMYLELRLERVDENDATFQEWRVIAIQSDVLGM